jgi:hypothetical protein
MANTYTQIHIQSVLTPPRPSPWRGGRRFPKIFHYSIALLIVFASINSVVYWTIHLNYQSCLVTIKIGNIILDRMLSPKF